jgi:hypothetical protein
MHRSLTSITLPGAAEVTVIAQIPRRGLQEDQRIAGVQVSMLFVGRMDSPFRWMKTLHAPIARGGGADLCGLKAAGLVFGQAFMPTIQDVPLGTGGAPLFLLQSDQTWPPQGARHTREAFDRP